MMDVGKKEVRRLINKLGMLFWIDHLPNYHQVFFSSDKIFLIIDTHVSNENLVVHQDKCSSQN